MMCIFHLAFRNWMIESPFPNEGKELSKMCFGGSQINEVISMVVNIWTYDVARGGARLASPKCHSPSKSIHFHKEQKLLAFSLVFMAFIAAAANALLLAVLPQYYTVVGPSAIKTRPHEIIRVFEVPMKYERI